MPPIDPDAPIDHPFGPCPISAFDTDVMNQNTQNRNNTNTHFINARSTDLSETNSDTNTNSLLDSLLNDTANSNALLNDTANSNALLNDTANSNDSSMQQQSLISIISDDEYDEDDDILLDNISAAKKKKANFGRQHRKFQIRSNESVFIVTSPVNRKDYNIRVVARSSVEEPINYGTSTEELVHRISPLMGGEKYNYCSEYVEGDIDFGSNKFPFGRKEGHWGCDNKKMKIIEHGCHSQYICPYKQCPRYLLSGIPYTVAASKSHSVFQREKLNLQNCPSCKSKLIHPNCNAVEGFIQMKSPDTVNGREVLFYYRLHAHNEYCLTAPDTNGIPSRNAALVREIASLGFVPKSDQLMKGWVTRGKEFNFHDEHPALWQYGFREKILRRVKQAIAGRPSNKSKLADQFICVNSWVGEMELFVKDKSIGAKRDSYLCLQSPEMSDFMDKVIHLVLYYDKEDLELVHLEMKENDDFKQLSTAGDATCADFGNGQVITFVARSKILDRVMPIQFGIKIADDWLPFCRFALNLFLKYVIDDDEFADFNIRKLIGKWYNRHDFCSKYFKGWCVAMGIMSDVELCRKLCSCNVNWAEYLRSLSPSEINTFYNIGKPIMDEIAMGCRIHKGRSGERVSKIAIVIPPTQRSIFLSMFHKLDTISDAEIFGKLIDNIIKKFPKLKKYFSYWLSPAVIKRAYPKLTGKSDDLIACIKHHQQDVEWMHHNVKDINPCWNDNTNVEEITKTCLRWANSVFKQERMTAIGYKTVRPNYSKKKSGGVYDGRGYDKQSQYINYRSNSTSKEKFVNVILSENIKTLKSANKGKSCHKFKLNVSAIHSIIVEDEQTEECLLGLTSIPMPKQPNAECGVYGGFAENQLKPKETDVQVFLTGVCDNITDIKKKGNGADFKEDFLLSTASITESLNNKRALKTYVIGANNIVRDTGATPNSNGSYIQWISSSGLQTIQLHNHQSYIVLDHPNHIIKQLEDAGTQDILKQIYDKIEQNGNSGFIMTNTSMNGIHWKTFYFMKTTSMIMGLTQEPTGYNSRDTETISIGMKLLECIINGAGMASNVYLKDAICSPFMTIRRGLELLTPHSDKLQDSFTSEIIQCINDKWRDEWREQINELNNTCMKITDDPVRLLVDQICQSILPLLQLSDDEKLRLSDLSPSSRGVNLGRIRAMAAFNLLSEPEQTFITNIIIARNIKSIQQINLIQTASACSMVFNDNTFNDFVKDASDYMLNMNANKLNDLALCSDTLSELNKAIEAITIKIRKKAYEYGWNIVCSFSNTN
eukprot:223859_1